MRQLERIIWILWNGDERRSCGKQWVVKRQQEIISSCDDITVYQVTMSSAFLFNRMQRRWCTPQTEERRERTWNMCDSQEDEAKTSATVQHMHTACTGKRMSALVIVCCEYRNTNTGTDNTVRAGRDAGRPVSAFHALIPNSKNRIEIDSHLIMFLGCHILLLFSCSKTIQRPERPFIHVVIVVYIFSFCPNC